MPDHGTGASAPTPTPTRVSPGQLEELRVLGAESRWVRNGDVDLHVLDYGGDKPPLLVLPGITSPAITWDFVVAPLRDLVRPVVMDLRGRGLSGPGDGYRAGDFAQDAQAAIEQLELDRPIVLGHSLGARIGAALAASGTAQLRSTILVDPPLSGPDRGPYPTSREAFSAQLDQGYAGTTGDEVRAFYPQWPRAELLLRARWLNTCEEAAVLATYDEFTREDFFPWWAAVSAPAAFIRGGDSPVVTESGAAEAATVNPAASQHVVAGAGHMVPWDRYAEFMAQLRPLLQDHLASAG
jgi:N-formylmaleamate deformylase